MGVINIFDDEYWMQHAIEAARIAEQMDEVPVGAALVKDNQLIATSSNSSIHLNDPSAHAEVLVLRKSSEILRNYRLPGTVLYVTLEPCMMCAGAMLHARIERLVFGAYDEKTGVAGGCFNWLEDDKHMHKVKVHGGVLKNECSAMLQQFFKNKRKSAK